LLDAQPCAGTERKALELRWRLLAAREETLDFQGARAAQRASIETLESLAEALADDRRRAIAAQRRSTLEIRMVDWIAAEAAAQRALAWATAAGDVALRRSAQRAMAMALIYRNDLTGAEALLEPALAEARTLELHRVQGFCLGYLAEIADRRGNDVARLELQRQALAAFEAQGDRRNEAIARSNLGVGWLNVGQFHQARRELEEGLRLSRAVGDVAPQCVPLYSLSTLARWQGDDSRALALARNTVETAVALQARDAEAIALLALGDAELALGRHASAAQAFTRAQDLAIEINHPWQQNAAAGLARVALAQGDSAAALKAIAPLLTLDADRGGNASVLEGTECPREIELTCYRVLGAQPGGDPRAFDWLRRAHEALQAGGARLTDARVRQGYFQNIPHHREIVAAWARRGAGGEAAAVAVG
jgi:tetratricopeptide (TPR) repeat protein